MLNISMEFTRREKGRQWRKKLILKQKKNKTIHGHSGIGKGRAKSRAAKRKASLGTKS